MVLRLIGANWFWYSLVADVKTQFIAKGGRYKSTEVIKDKSGRTFKNLFKSLGFAT